MAVTAKKFGKATLNAYQKKVSDLAAVGSDIRVVLCSSSYTPNQDTHESKSDVTGEVVGTGYVAGGVVLSGRTLTYDAATNVIAFKGADVEWPNSTITARYAVIYDNTPATAGDKKLIAYVDFGEDKVSSDGTFKLLWHVDGIFKVTVA